MQDPSLLGIGIAGNGRSYLIVGDVAVNLAGRPDGGERNAVPGEGIDRAVWKFAGALEQA